MLSDSCGPPCNRPVELSCHGSTEKEAYSPGSPGCTAEGLSEPSLNRMSRSLPSGIEGGRACQVEKTERVCDRESEGAGKVRSAWAYDPVGRVARRKAGETGCGSIVRGLVILLRSVAMGSQEGF